MYYISVDYVKALPRTRTSKASTPIYLKIRNAIRDAIAQGAYGPGDLLPSETDLAKRYGTTRSTVVHALQQLVYEGLVERRRGIGSFVARPNLSTTLDTHRLGYFEQDVFSSGKGLEFQVISFAKATVDDQVRQNLRLRAGEPVFKLQRLRLLDGAPIAFELRYLPALIAVQITQDMLSSHAVQDILAQHVGISVSKYVNSIRVALPPAPIADYLKTGRGRPVLVRTYLWLDAQGTPLLWGETLYREEYSVRYTLGAP